MPQTKYTIRKMKRDASGHFLPKNGTAKNQSTRLELVKKKKVGEHHDTSAELPSVLEEIVRDETRKFLREILKVA